MDADEEVPQPTFTDKIVRQMKAHPLIPTGMLATCGALGMAFRRMNQRDAIGYQRWLRARVLAQGLTIVAIVVAGVQEVGMGALTGQLRAAQPPVTTEHDTRGFQRRLKEAEEAHNAETIAAASPGLGTEAVAIVKPSESAGVSSPARLPGSSDDTNKWNSSVPSVPPSQSSSWLSWLGISRK